jgi:hypothetical protein
MRRYLASLLLLAFLVACSSNPATVTVLPTAALYQTPTLTETPTVIPPLDVVILPTPTTFTYTVVLGDSLIGIAGRFGVTLEALQAANPSIQASVLQPGVILIIPTGSQPTGEPSPTPAYPLVLQTRCFPEADGGLWCFALMQNPFAETLENLSAQFTLLDAGGQPLSSQVAYGLLDILPAGRSMPLAIHFPPPVKANAGVRVDLLTAVRLLPGDDRYLPVTLDDTLVDIGASGLSAQLTGRLTLTGGDAASTVWVLAIAYDSAGNVIGIRRWDSSTPLAAGSPLHFDFQVSSLGPPIEKVEILVEARP